MQDKPLVLLKDALKYHQGSVACGAPRFRHPALISYMLASGEEDEGPQHEPGGPVHLVLHQLLRSHFSRLIAFITGQAYVMISIEGRATAMRAGSLIASRHAELRSRRRCYPRWRSCPSSSALCGLHRDLGEQGVLPRQLQGHQPAHPLCGFHGHLYLLASKFFVVIETSTTRCSSASAWTAR